MSILPRIINYQHRITKSWRRLSKTCQHHAAAASAELYSFCHVKQTKKEKKRKRERERETSRLEKINQRKKKEKYSTFWRNRLPPGLTSYPPPSPPVGLVSSSTVDWSNSETADKVLWIVLKYYTTAVIASLHSATSRYNAFSSPVYSDTKYINSHASGGTKKTVRPISTQHLTLPGAPIHRLVYISCHTGKIVKTSHPTISFICSPRVPNVFWTPESLSIITSTTMALPTSKRVSSIKISQTSVYWRALSTT